MISCGAWHLDERTLMYGPYLAGWLIWIEQFWIELDLTQDEINALMGMFW